MTDRHTKIQTWLGLITIVFLLLAFFGVSRFTDFFGNSQSVPAGAAPTPTPTPAPVEPQTAPTEIPPTSELPRIAAKGAHASLSLGPVKAGGTRELVTTVTVKLHNDGKLPFTAAWLTAEDNASFDLGIGRLAVAHSSGPFAGMPNCNYSNAGLCRSAGGIDLASGSTQQVTMALETDLPAAESARALKAKRGTLTARLVLCPPEPGVCVEKSISAEVTLDR
jgi:hypothetical protein